MSEKLKESQPKLAKINPEEINNIGDYSAEEAKKELSFMKDQLGEGYVYAPSEYAGETSPEVSLSLDSIEPKVIDPGLNNAWKEWCYDYDYSKIRAFLKTEKGIQVQVIVSPFSPISVTRCQTKYYGYGLKVKNGNAVASAVMEAFKKDNPGRFEEVMKQVKSWE